MAGNPGSDAALGTQKPMFSGSPRTKKFPLTEQEAFYMNCRTAYLTIFKSSLENIISKDQLYLALQHAGRSPSQKTINKYWTPQTAKLNFDDFCIILSKEKPTSKAELLKSFKQLDVNDDGSILHSDLHKYLTKRGEKMTKEEVNAVISLADVNANGKFDYMKFCKLYMTTSEQCLRTARERLEADSKLRRQQFGSHMEGSALSEIFEVIDLDGNGLISLEEYNFFELRTSGEKCDEDAWAVCRENFDTKKNELTRQGFMDLHLMEANDREGDPLDLWVTLHSMGYNKALELTEACPFVINIYAERCKPRIKAIHMEACSGQLEKAICKSVLGRSDAKVMDGYENIIVHTCNYDTWITSIIENKSDDKVIIHINNELSKNCVNNRGLNVFAVEVAPRSTMVNVLQNLLSSLFGKKYLLLML
ncbi:EF-hand calcium-binding domain-containing protein 7 [Microtus ochrogaster]|uniref:EF-hand calcium-binding domain-containing protein 7 n=1 Tax=Microtus ochrogaster TaxID=79684 RepID=A0A8J6GFV4_MICOH|nr:EF-hand calcium-binding domain-containing protein 7 [Microtus ochrogaster]